MNLNSLYTEVIMEQNASKHNKKIIKDANIIEDGHNPSCGDEIKLQLKLNKDNVIEDAAYVGVGCAISQASTSIMIDLIKGKSVKEAKSLVNTFLGMIKSEITDDKKLEVLDDALAFKNISQMPSRVKCAVLAWHTLDECLKDK